MIIQNNSRCSVRVITNNLDRVLPPAESILVKRTDCSFVKLAHTYQSCSVSDKQLLREDMDVDLISVFASQYSPASFTLVMDTVYSPSAFPEDAVLSVVRQRVRASVDCAYDRLAVQYMNAIQQPVQHIIPEKARFLNQYKTVSHKGTYIPLGLSIAGVVAFFAGLIILCILMQAKGFLVFLLGFVVILGVLIPLEMVCLVVCLTNTADQRLFAKNFDNQQIARCFVKAASTGDETYVID